MREFNLMVRVHGPKSRGIRSEQRGWYIYDWANSAFYTTVVTVFLGPYLTGITEAAAGPGGYVYPLGIKVSAGSYFPYLVSLSVVLQVLLLPLMGAIADYSNRKKLLLAVSAYAGALATMGLYYLEGERYLYGGALFLTANTCFGASEVIYNAFLPEISTPEERDSVSSKGWAIGYLGGGVLLALDLLLVFQAPRLGLTTGRAVRISLASAGAWWALFTIIPLISLGNHLPSRRLPSGTGYLSAGLRQLKGTISRARAYPQTLLFLCAFLLYNDGIQTVITLSSQFGQEELKLGISTLTALVLMVQFVAFFGSMGFNYVAGLTGTKKAIIISLIIWIGVVVYAYGLLRTTMQFFVLGGIIAIVLGGSQALTRSLYSKMIPEGQEAEYFSLYEVTDKGTSWLGPLLFGLALQFTASYRVAILSLVVFFVAGLILLIRVDVRRAAGERTGEGGQS